MIEYNDSGEYSVYSEKMKSELNEGVYKLIEMHWSRSSIDGLDIPQEVFAFENGEVRSWSDNGCVLYTICANKMAVIVEDYSAIKVGLEYSYKCSDG